MVRGGGGRRGAAGGRRGRGRGGGGRGGEHLGMGQVVDGDGPPIPPAGQAWEVNPVWYERSHERFTWNGVLCAHPDPAKRISILPNARDRDKDIIGSCVYYSIATALEAAYRIAGVEVEELAWEELYNRVDEHDPRRTTAALRVLKYRGIHKRVDYKKKNFNGKRFKVSQFYEFCNVDLIREDTPCGLDQNNMKAAINNVLSRTVMLAHFPISANYYCLDDGEEHIYAYDEHDPIVEDKKRGESGLIPTHVVVVTGFGFEETIPYFEFLDCNGNKFGKKGFGRILPSSIISLYAFDIIMD